LGVAAFLISILVTVPLCSCGDGGSGPKQPKAGEAVLTLSGAASDDGAVLLVIGPGPTGIAAGGPEVEVHFRQGSQGFTVAVFGPLADHELLRITLPDRSVLPAVTLKEVAAENGQLRPGLASYEATLKLRR
jgi:hypothetical protein